MWQRGRRHATFERGVEAWSALLAEAAAEPTLRLDYGRVAKLLNFVLPLAQWN